MHYLRHLFSMASAVIVAALLVSCSNVPLEPDVTTSADVEQELAPGQDTGVDTPEVIDYGEIILRVLPPQSFCGCDGIPSFQTEDSLCGWHLSEGFEFQVQALHSAQGFEGVKGIAQVKLYQYWPTGQGDIKLKTLSTPDSSGLFSFQVDKDQLDLADPPDGTYWLRIEAVSKISGADGLAMTKDLVIPIDVDTTGPEIKIISPLPGQKLSATAAIVFSAEDGEFNSGVEEFQVMIMNKQGEWDPLEVSFPVEDSTVKTTYVDNLDLTDFDTQDTTLRVLGFDCLGNASFADVEVRIIAIPRFVTPTTLKTVPLEGETNPIFERIYATQCDRLQGDDPDDPPLDLLLTSNLGAYVAWGASNHTFSAPTLVISQPDTIDARLHDINGNGVPDLVALSTEEGQEKKVVTLWVQDTTTGAKPKGLRTFQLAEKRSVQVEASKLDLADVTGDGRQDVLVLSSQENETLYVLHHTGKTANVPGGAAAYLDYPLSFTGVTGGVDITHSETNGDGAVDVIIGRTGASAITTFLNDGEGHFDIGVDSLVGFGNGTENLLMADLDSDGFEDAIVFHQDLGALIFMENIGNGYFDFHGIPIGSSLAEWGNANAGSQIPSMAVEYDPELETGPMVMIDGEIGGLVRGYFDDDDVQDLAVTAPGEKLVRIFRGVKEGDFSGSYRQERFLNAGAGPAAIAAGDFNGDGMDDIAVVNEGTDVITVLMSESGSYHATIELPMPLTPAWDAGQIAPVRALVADFGQPLSQSIQAPDGREDLLVITEPVLQSWDFQGELPEEEDTVEEIGVPLLLTYMGLGLPDGPDYSFVKTATSYHMTGEISGAVVGNFDNDIYLDLAISTQTDPGSVEEGGNFDILRGGISALASDPTGDGLGLIHGIAGRFWPLGGFIGPRNPTDIAAAPLNSGDDLDDLVMIAPQVGDISEPSNFQWARAASYITRFDKTWNSCANSYKQVSFECCQAQDPALPCAPSADDVCANPEKGGCEGSITGIGKVGYAPAKVIVDYISTDPGADEPDGIPDVLVLNRESDNFSYFIGTNNDGSYSFQTILDQPNIYAVGSAPVDMDVGDLDGDFIPDVVVALHSSLVIAYGQASATHHFETAKPLDKGPDSEDMAPTGVLMADVNLDGFMDIVTSSTGKSRIWIYISAGDREFLGPYPFECGKDPVDVVEINLRGSEPPCPHLAVVNSGSKSISILQNERCD